VRRRTLEAGINATGKKSYILDCKKNWEKVLFSDESHFFRSGKHSRFVRIMKGEQVSLTHFHDVIKHLKIY